MKPTPVKAIRKHLSEAHRKNIGNANKGRVPSEETRNRIATSLKISWERRKKEGKK